MMDKLDLAKKYKAYYSAPAKPELIELEEIPYLTITDKGDPSGPVFASATEALFTMSYAVKFVCKKLGNDFTVPKLEGQWWVESDTPALETPRDEWHWKIRIRMPDFVNQEIADEARQNAIAKKKGLSQLKLVNFEHIAEGECVQMMHVGPYATEPETMGQMKDFMASEGLVLGDKHHIEIYLSDPRKVEPAKMKTIIRFPVKKA